MTYSQSKIKMLPLQTRHAASLSRKRHSLHFYAVLLGTIWLCTCTSVNSEEYGRVGRKLSSPLYDDHELLDASQLSNEDLHSLISILEAKQRAQEFGSTTQRSHVPTILPELIRNHQNPPTISPTTTTERPPVSRVTTRRFYRRLRRKPTTQAPNIPSSSTTEAKVEDGGSSGRMLPATGPGELLNQLSLLNGILGALNATSENSTAPTSQQQNAPTSTIPSNNDNANKDNATSVHDILALLAGASSEASSKSEVVVPPPSPSSSPGQVDDNTANALALLNLFSGNNDNKNGGGGNSASVSNLLNLVAQSQPTQQQSQSTSVSEADATAALTKLLLQSSAPSAQSMQSNSLQQSNDASANQLSSLLGLLGTLGAASGGGLQSQTSAAGINNLFNLGGDQQTAQAQQANSLASLFGGAQQQQQNQNLLNLFGGNQNQANRFDLTSLLAPQSGANSIPGLGLLSTMSSLGTSIFSTVSNLFGGSNLGGKPRVRGKGVDTRLGLGYRLGNVGDAQIVWDIGPQLFTDPLRNEVRPSYTKKRESGAPASYLAPANAAAVEKEVQKTEAKRRMVQSAIHDQYHRNVYDHYPGVYPTKYRRSNSHFDYPSATTSRPYYYSTTSTSTTAAPSYFSSGFSLPFTDHIKGFWSGLTSAQVEDSTPKPGYYNFEDIRHDFSTNLIKRSSPDFGDYEGRAYHQQPRRRQDDYDTEDEQDHSTLTEYERMLLQYGKDMGIGGVPDTRHSSTQEPHTSESSVFDKWFRPSSTSSSRNDEDHSYRRGASPSGLRSEWGPGSMTSGSNEYPAVRKPPKKPKTYGHDQSFDQRNDHPRRNNKNRPSRPPQRRSHNPFRWLSAFKPQSHHHKQHHHHNHNHHQGQRPRAQSSQYSQFADFERRHYKRPGGGNPKLQHFTNMNKDLMMADANIDDFVQSAGIESLPGAYDQPFEYNYASEFPDVPLTLPPRRLRPSEMTTAGYMGKLRASMSHRDRVVEPALLYDHLEVKDDSKPPSEADESFHQRNKVVVNAKLREIEKQKVLGTAAPTPSGRPTKVPVSLNKLQRMRLNKLRAKANGTRTGARQKIIVKVKGKGNHGQYKASQFPTSQVPMSQMEEDAPESSTAIPSVFSTIGSLLSGTTKPKLFSNLIQNATSYLPSLRILPRKKQKDQKTRLTLMNGKPTVVGPPDDDDQDMEGAELPPVVQVGHDMSFGDLQTIFSASKDNSTKRRRFRIRVKESALKGETASDKKDDDPEKERRDSESEEDDEEAKDIFVDIESGEVSVLKPVASLVSFAPKQEEPSQEEEIDYYEDDDGDGVADMDMKRKEHIFTAIQKQLVHNFEKLKKAEAKVEAKKRRKEELAKAGMDESMDQVMKMFDYHQDDKSSGKDKQPKITHAGGLPL